MDERKRNENWPAESTGAYPSLSVYAVATGWIFGEGNTRTSRVQIKDKKQGTSRV